MPSERDMELKEEVTKLKMLLDDPQPGLFTWCDFVNQRIKKINELWYGSGD